MLQRHLESELLSLLVQRCSWASSHPGSDRVALDRVDALPRALPLIESRASHLWSFPETARLILRDLVNAIRCFEQLERGGTFKGPLGQFVHNHSLHKAGQPFLIRHADSTARRPELEFINNLMRDLYSSGNKSVMQASEK